MRRKRVVLGGGLLLAIAGLFLLREGQTAPCTPPRSRANLILISLDTLRADRLGSYGHDRDTSPRIDRFAKRAVVFRNAVAPTSWTLPSHLTMLTGLDPGSHGVVTAHQRLNRRTALLSEMLQRSGYYTFAITGGGYLSSRHGFARGFDSFESQTQKQKGGLGRALAKAREQIRSLPPKRPYFAFLHTYDLHCPYAPPEPFHSMFQSPGAEEIETAGRCGPDLDSLALSEGQARWLSDRYDGGVRWVDSLVGEFLDFLESRGSFGSSIVVITSDHGEEFLEHGQIGHSRTLYREALMIPLIIAAPGAVPREVDALVGLADLTPTLLDLLGLPAPGRPDGRSLAPFFCGDGPAADFAPFRLSVLHDLDAETGLRLVSWMDATRHFIWDPVESRPLLFDLRRDPAERSDRADERRDEVERLRREVAPALGREALRPAQAASPPSAAELEQLRALGYTGDPEVEGR
jgi:arylsulfatase A-like enzyme